MCKWAQCASLCGSAYNTSTIAEWTRTENRNKKQKDPSREQLHPCFTGNPTPTHDFWAGMHQHQHQTRNTSTSTSTNTNTGRWGQMGPLALAFWDYGCIMGMDRQTHNTRQFDQVGGKTLCMGYLWQNIPVTEDTCKL